MRDTDLRLNHIKVDLFSDPEPDVPGRIVREMEKIRGDVTPGMRIAVTVGSRGICRIHEVARTVVDCFRAWGAEPFIVPAMGSHGGATAEGQARVLADYGIMEETMGVPIRSSMAVAELGRLPENPDIRLYMDRNAYEADKVFVINRVKPHTDFHGYNESGIAKMLVIGLGKQAQAIAVHNYLLPGLRDYVPAVARAVIATGHILGGLALVEDGHDQLSIIECARPEDIVETDHRLLEKVRHMTAQLPFAKCDVLLVDWMGKDITGSGMDTNVVGRLRIEGAEHTGPKISRICVLDLTEPSHGNALGIGIADITTRRLADKIDWKATYENVLTSRFVERGFLPIVQECDRDVVNTALYTCGHVTAETVRFARIRDTLHLGEMYVSDALLADMSGDERIHVLERGLPLCFDGRGDLNLL